MATVISKDGTRIAFERAGAGPAVILVDGALCYRASGPMGPIARQLTPHFTVFTYDRRGRGESGNTEPYAVAREVEDLEALIAEAGGSAHVFGISSGAALALEAAKQGLPIQTLVLYEAPFFVDDSRAPAPADFLERMKEAVAENRRGDAVKMFMKLVGVPGIFIALMRVLPAWSKLIGVAHTLPHDLTIVGEYQKGQPLPFGRWSKVAVPTAVMDGGKSPVWMRNATRALARAIPRATYHTLPGQTHVVKAGVLGPVLVKLFQNGSVRAAA